MTKQGEKEILKLIAGVGSKPFNILSIGDQSKKAEITILDNVLEYTALFKVDNDTYITQTSITNENGVILDIDEFEKIYLKAGSSIEITHTIQLYDTEKRAIRL